MAITETFQRCPRCGNENPADSFACSFCGKRLKIERIEQINIFRRIEQEWYNPLPFYYKLLYLFIRPNVAFWDINHKRKSAPGYIVLLLNSLLYGLMGLAILSRFRITKIGSKAVGFFHPTLFFYRLTIFLVFFGFGFIFQLILFSVLIWLFSKGANYSVDFSARLEARFGEREEGKMKYSEELLSPFSIYRGGTLLQTQEAYKYKMMFCAFTPFLLINTVKILIILIAFPTVAVSVSGSIDPTIFESMFYSTAWAVMDVLDALTIGIWVPILITIAIRELANSSTIRVLIPSLIIGIIFAIIFYFLRPTIIG
ncbi:MAG: hypothetical protein ACTSYC_01755 [Promethearchaeota archaeon]